MEAQPEPLPLPSSQHIDAPRIALEDTIPSTYGDYCGRGIPLVVTGVAFQGSWTPTDIVQKYGDHTVFVEDCESGDVTESTAGDFFRQFGDPSGGAVRKVKVRNFDFVQPNTNLRHRQDWPPSGSFSKTFEDLHRAFMAALPFPDIQRFDGVLNFAAHFPDNMCPPDLG